MKQSQKLNPLLKPFGVLIGTWELESPQFPGAKGKAMFEWLEDGSYLLQHSFAPPPAPSSTQIIGSDESDKSIIALYYDTRNVSRIYQMSLMNGIWKIWREAPGFFQRFEGKLSKDKNTIIGRWEKSSDGTHWEHDFDLIYKRVMQKNIAIDDERAIRELIETWMTATKAGDIQTVLDLMTDDVVFMVPGQEPFGKETFRETAEEMKGGDAGGVRYEGKSNIEEIKVMGEWAYIRTHLNVTTIPSGGGAPIHRSGFTLTIFRKESDGKWRLARDANLLTMKK